MKNSSAHEAGADVHQAKKSTGREFVRMAIGQVLDYAHNARALRSEVAPVILLPGRAERDLTELAEELRIIVASRDGDSFHIARP